MVDLLCINEDWRWFARLIFGGVMILFIVHEYNVLAGGRLLIPGCGVFDAHRVYGR